MTDLKVYLNQINKYISTSKGNVIFPYQTNFSFLSKYPFEMLKIAIPKWTRVDGVGRVMVDAQDGWKLLCIFNDLVSPIELINKDYIYLPSDFNTAIQWLQLQNKKTRKQ